MFNKIVCALTICLLWSTSVLAEYVILKGNTYIADVKIVSVDVEQLIFIKGDKEYSFSMNAVEKISAQPPSDGTILQLGYNESQISKQEVVSSQLGTTVTAIRSQSPKIEKKMPELSFEEKLRFKGGFFGGTYWKGEKKLAKNDIESMFQKYPEITQQYNLGNSTGLLGVIIESVGGGLIAYPVVEYFTEVKYPNWTLAAMGVTLFMPALFINLAAEEKYKVTTELYNLKQTERINKTTQSLNFEVAPLAVRISWKF